MAVKMRLKRMGKKRNPIYRVVVADAEIFQEMEETSMKSVSMTQTRSLQ